MKRLIVIFIVLLCSTAAKAQFSGGNGTENNPYIITTAEELAQLATYVNDGDTNYNDKYYELGSNIDLSDYQSGEGWTSIGITSDNGFSGVFDGNNKKITGLKINATSQYFAGLFGYVSDGKIINLGVENADVSVLYSSTWAGIVTGYLYNSITSNCYSTGMVNAHSTSNTATAGGFAGSIAANSTVSNCYSTGTVSAYSSSYDAFAGGFAGFISYSSTVSNCYSTGAVNAHSTYSYAFSGGVAGYIWYGSTLSNCYSTGKVSAKSVNEVSIAGGIIGYVENANVSHCVALNPAVLCTGLYKYFGRVIGYKDGTSGTNLGFADMYNYYGNEWINIGEANLDGETISKVQILADGTFGNRFTADNGWTTQNGKLPGFGAPVELPDFMTEPTVVNVTVSPAKVWMNKGSAQQFETNVFVFNNAPTSVTWSVEGGVAGTGISPSGLLTVSANETALSFTVVATSTYDNTITGIATVYVSLVITTAEELAQVATHVNAGNADYMSGYFILGNDIDLSIYQGGSGWTPIGYDKDNLHVFQGVFDGNHKKITGLKINTTGPAYVGLFGYVYNGTIKNLGIENADIYRGNTANNNLAYVGIFAGCIYSGVVSDCYATGTVISNSIGVSRTAYGGGVAGISYGSTITNCYSGGTIYAYCGAGAEAGGLVGEMQSGTISNCYSTASVTANANANNYTSAGGIAGDLLYSTISNCYATGSVGASNSNSRVGGIAGQHSISTVSNCAALNTGIISQDQYGRVVGTSIGTLISNVAFTNMLNPAGNTTWNNIGASNKDGENISCGDILADGTLGSRFTNGGGWTTQNGKLPGLFGNVIDLPEYLCSSAHPPVIISIVLPSGTVDVAYSKTLEANGNGPITWNITNGTLPTGLTLNETTGVISGLPTVAGTFSFIVKATNAVGSDTKYFTILIQSIPLPPTIITTTLANGTVNEVYTVFLEATGNKPITWNIETGTLPTGLIMYASGVITGIPAIAGTFTFTVKATNAVGSDTKQLTLLINPVSVLPTIITTTLANGTVNVAYSETLEATGDAPITWNIETGTLPTGLTLNETTGVISEIPTVAGTFTFTVKATNAVGSDTKQLSITVNEPSLITETEIESIKVYPNPTTGLLTICDMRNSHPLEGVRGGTIFDVEIFDVMGRMVMTVAPVETHGRASLQSQIEQSQIGQSKIGNRTSQIEINISHLPAGVYFVRIQTEQETVTKKVMKVNGN